MGVVYLADDTRLRRPVAIKALTREFTGDNQRRDRLRREAQAAAALSHPGIATVYALEEFDDNLYIVCEYVPGETLRAEVDNGPLPLGPLLNAAVEIARALVAAHEHGVIHRDLKPENVIRTEDGGIKVLDFGVGPVPEHSAPGCALLNPVDGARDDPRHSRLHRTRATPRGERRFPGRHLLLRRHAVRAGGRCPSV